MLSAKSLIGSHDVLMITLDTLRYDVAVDALDRGMTPKLASLLPSGRWERRHSPGSFTYAAHQAFFAGFLPTPTGPGPHRRLFAAEFPGSETTCEEHTWVFPEANLVKGLAACGYHTVCIGGVGFFNCQTALGRALPSLFEESFWDASLGVTERRSTENQVAIALQVLRHQPDDQRLFLFLNISALHQPNCMYIEGRQRDDASTQAAALAYVDCALAPLWNAMASRAPVLAIVTSDHGTAYGEDGYHGHRVGHPVVWEVPYAEFVLDRQPNE
jgi:hypothetical protein